MSAVDKSLNDGKPHRSPITRRKLWLSVAGLTVLLIAGVLLVAAFIPRSLNTTEQKLLGRWENKSLIIDFRHEEVLSGPSASDLEAAYWTADGNTLSATDSGFKYRLKSALGLETDSVTYEIERLTKDELHLRFAPGGQVFELRRRDRSVE